MMKKALKTQSLRAGRSKTEPKIFYPPQTPFPGAQDGQNLISWRWSLPLSTNPVWWGSDARKLGCLSWRLRSPNVFFSYGSY